MKLSARNWNESVSLARRGQIFAGRNVRMQRTHMGQCVSASGPSEFKHPWQLQPFWNAELNVWCCRVVPGFVNGRDVVMAMDGKDGSEDVPLTATTMDENQVEDAPTFEDADGPYLQMGSWDYPLAARSPGRAALTGSLWSFFKALGVREPEAMTSPMDETGSTKTIVHYTPESANPGTKELLSADVVLTGDHVGRRMETIISDPLSTGQTVANYVAIIPQISRYPFRLNAMPRFIQQSAAPDLLDGVLGSVVESNCESLLIGRLWLLSPDHPDEMYGDEGPSPDETWQPLVQNFVFWNLSFGAQDNIQRLDYAPLTLQTGLAGGIADSIFASMLAPINDANQLSLQILNRSQFKAFFWS